MDPTTPQRVSIVTGSTSGIGLETARGLARRGHRVVLAVRDEHRGEAARAEILRTQPGAEVDVLRLDLARQGSIREFVEAFSARFDRLDVLVNNAALVPSARTLTADGLETQFGVNHLGPFLLTNLLLPRLQASRPSRVVVLSSSVYAGKHLDFDDLQSEKGYSQMGAYSRSKLANMLFVRALARRLEGTGVTVNAVHPGVVSTQLARDMPAPFRLMAKLFFTTPEKGARTSIFLATAPEVEHTSGKYFAASREAALDASALDDAAAEQLWQVSAKLSGLGAGAGA